MGAITERAEELAATLKAAGIRNVATDIGKVRTPCVLVVPVPAWTFQNLSGAATVTWTLVVLGSLPANLKSAAAMEDLVIRVAAALPVEAATPTSYQTGEAEQPLPAYELTLTDEVEL